MRFTTWLTLIFPQTLHCTVAPISSDMALLRTNMVPNSRCFYCYLTIFSFKTLSYKTGLMIESVISTNI